MRITLLIICLFGAVSAHGAELTEVDDGICHFLLSGPIVAGDDNKLAEIEISYQPLTLCLNSGGGNLAEGLRLFDRIWRYNFHTVVLPMHSCESACAIAFMGGSDIQGTDLTRQIVRNVVPGAKIGFHGPQINLPKGRIQRTEFVQRAYRGAIKTATRLFEVSQISEKGGTTISDFLLGMILRTPPEKMYRVETVGDLILSDIWPTGVAYRYPKQDDFVINVCRNLLAKNPPSNYQFDLATGTQEHYYDNTDVVRPGTKKEDIYFVPKVETKKLSDGSLYGWAGPFFSGTKYAFLECLVRLEPNIEYSPSWNSWADDYDMIGIKDSAGYNDSSFVSADIRLIYPSEEKKIDRFSYISEFDLKTIPHWYIYSYDRKISDLPIDPEFEDILYKRGYINNETSNNSNSEDFNYVKFDGYDLKGDDLDLIFEITSGNCLRRCDRTRGCDAITHDRWNNFCVLKKMPEILMVNSKADSFILDNKKNNIKYSREKILLTKRKNKYFPGSPDKKIKTNNLNKCSEYCLNFKGCIAFNFAGKECSIFRKTGEYIDKKGYTAGYFTQ